MPNNKTPTIVAICLLTLGALFVSLTIYLYQGTPKFINNAITTTGTIIDFSKETTTNQETRKTTTSYYPIIEYKTKQNKTYQYKSPISIDENSDEIGETIEILYLPNNPEKVRINSTKGLWGPTIASTVFATILLTAGLLTLLFIKLQGNKYQLPIIGSIIFFLVSIMLATLSWTQYQNTKQELQQYTTIKGTIKNITTAAPTNNESKQSSYIIDLSQAIGNLEQIVLATNTSPDQYEIGDKVTLHYPNHQPKKAIITTFFTLWTPSLLLGLMSLAFSLPWLITLIRILTPDPNATPNKHPNFNDQTNDEIKTRQGTIIRQ